MKILSATQIREADRATIADEGIPSFDLMERAATAVNRRILDLKPETFSAIYVFCGTGNNGGDGLAVARMLIQNGQKLKVILLRGSNYSPDNAANQNLLRKSGADITIIDSAEQLTGLVPGALVIDALTGTGMRMAAKGLLADVITFINRSKCFVVSVDLPSGLPADPSDFQSGAQVVYAALTLTFELPKLSLLLPDTGKYTQQWEILAIGLNEDFIREAVTPYHMLTHQIVTSMRIARERFSHKGNFGHALIVAGSQGMAGAAVLATLGALRSGAGLVTARVHEQIIPIINTKAPEALTEMLDEEFTSTAKEYSTKYQAIGIGPGIGRGNESMQMLKRAIQCGRSLVLDADALNILSENKTWLEFISPMSILTPHPGEFDRLFGPAESSRDRLKIQMEMSVKHRVVIILKGAFSSISLPDGSVYFNTTGNPGMAKGGSGDVLTGLVTGLLAQGHSSSAAALMGAYIHGLAGDLASEELSPSALIAGDLLRFLGKAFKSID